MGTNYYFDYNICDCCGRYDTLHVGKNGTMLRAHMTDPYGDDPPTPVGEIRGWADWKQLFARVDGVARDEYGDPISIESLIGRFEATTPAQRRRQYDALVELPYTFDVRYDWLDADGFSVSAREFS